MHICCSVLALLAACTAIAIAQPATDRPAQPKADQPERAPKAPAAMTPEQEQEAWMQAGTPGPAHEHLAAMVGEWNCKTRFWMGPGDPIESTGTSTHTWILGDRFVRQEFTGDMMGTPFHGLGFTGYDNNKKKYVGTWMDNWSTSIMHSEGAYDPATNTMTMHGQYVDPFGQTIKDRHVVKMESPDKVIFTMYSTKPGAEEMRVGEITYIRKGASDAKAGDAADRPRR